MNYEMQQAIDLVKENALIPYCPYEDSIEEAYATAFEQMSFEEKKTVYVSFILKGMEFPSFMGDLKHVLPMSKEFRSVYMSPFDASLTGDYRARGHALSFRQFLSLRQLFDGEFLDLTAPLILSPPEYWYLFCLCNTTDYTTVQTAFDSDPVLVWDGAPKFNNVGFRSISSAVRNWNLRPAFELLAAPGAVPFASKTYRGSKKHVPFTLTLPHLDINKKVIDCYPHFWNLFKSGSSSSLLMNSVAAIVELLTLVPPPQELPAASEALTLDKVQWELVKSDGDSVTVAEQTVNVPVPISLLHVPPEFDNNLPEIATCPGKDCCDDQWAVRSLATYGPNNWPLILNGRSLHVPLPEQANENWFDVMVGSQEFFVADDEHLSEIERPPDKGLEKVDLLVNGKIWRDYVNVDAIVARFAGLKLYDLQTNCPPTMPYDPTNLLMRNEAEYKAGAGHRKLPSTFQKWAYLFVSMGYVNLENGKYPVGKAPRPGNVAILEISAAPYGAMMAAIESGLCTNYFYTRFTGEQSKVPPYTTHIRDLLMDLKAQSTDLKGLAKAFRSSKKQQQRFSMLIIDIPMHRNSNMALSGKGLGNLNAQRDHTEFVDDAPLGKDIALAKHFGYVLDIVHGCLIDKGDLIVKVIEPWSKDVVDALWDLRCYFETLSVVRNPYSKQSSKELYFKFGSFTAANSSPANYDNFLSFVLHVNNLFIPLLTANLIRLSMMFGWKCAVERSVVCRKSLYFKKCSVGDILSIVKVPSVDSSWGKPRPVPRLTRKISFPTHLLPDKTDYVCVTDKDHDTVAKIYDQCLYRGVRLTYKECWMYFIVWGERAFDMLRTEATHETRTSKECNDALVSLNYLTGKEGLLILSPERYKLWISTRVNSSFVP